MRTFLLAKSQGPLHQVLQWILIPMVLGSLDPVGCKRRNAALTSDAADVAGSSGELFSDLLARSRTFSSEQRGWFSARVGRFRLILRKGSGRQWPRACGVQA